MSAACIATQERSASFHVLGVRVDAVQIPDVITALESWIQQGRSAAYVAFTSMHGLAESLQDAKLRHILNAADLVVPDGTPLVWLACLHDHALARRCYGPDFMEDFCRVTGARYNHFFYGAAPGVAARLGGTLQQRYGIRVAGSYSPPFRPLTEEEEAHVGRVVRRAAPDVHWVGLSTPKQERWMFEHRHRLEVPVMLGVGAAFDFHAGTLRQAPRWIRDHGLEWLFRFALEPRRLWRRYLVHCPTFVWNVSLELLGIRSFD